MKTILDPFRVNRNEAPERRFLDRSILKNAQGLSPRSSASLYRRIQSSTPWAMLANSRVLTFSSRYSMSSGGRVTFKDTFRMRGTMMDKESWSILYITNKHSHNTHKSCVGLNKDDRYKPNSGRYAPGRDGGENTDVPDRREWEHNTYDGQSVFRLLLLGHNRDLRENGGIGSRHGFEGEKDNTNCTAGMNMQAKFKPITATHDGRRFTLTTLIHPITILKGVIRRCRSFFNVTPAALKVRGEGQRPLRTHIDKIDWRCEE